MKPYIDFYSTIQSGFIASKVFRQRMLKYWGTTTVDGVEVFKNKFKLWPINTNDEDAVYARSQIYRFFNIDGDNIEDSPKDGIEGIYLTLEYRDNVDYSMYNDDAFALALEIAFPMNQTFTVTLTYSDPDNPTRFSGWTNEEVLTWFEDEADPFTLTAKADDISAESFAKFLLTEPVAAFDTSIDSYTTRISNSTTADGTAYSGITIVFSFTRVQFLNEDTITDDGLTLVNALRTALSGYNSNRSYALRTGDYNNMSTAAYTVISRMFADSSGHTDEFIWYRNYLRVSAASPATGLKSADFAVVFGRSIDTWIDEEEAEWWEIAIAVVLAITIFVVTAGGGSGIAAMTLSSFAAAAGTTAMVLTLLAMVAQSAGMYGLSKAFGNVAQIVGIASAVAGIAVVLQNIAQYGLTNTTNMMINGTTTVQVSTAPVASAATTSAIEAIGSNTVIGAVETAAGSGIFNVTFINPISVGGIASIGSKVLGVIQKIRTDMQADELNNMKDLVTEQANEMAALMDTELDIGAEDIVWSTKPLTVDWMKFSVDHLYEGTKYNIGRPSFYTGFGLNQLTVYDPDPYQLTARTPQKNM